MADKPVVKPPAPRGFAWRMTRRLRQRMSWDYWRDILVTLLWVAPLTLLIWGVAEREQIEDGEAVVRLEAISTDTTRSVRIVNPASGTFRLNFEGPRVGISKVQEDVQSSAAGGLPVTVSEGLPVGEESTVDIRQALQDVKLFRDNGVSVTSATPATMLVFVDRKVPQTWPVVVDPPLPPDLIVTIDPPSVTVFGPSRALTESAGRVTVRLSPAQLRQVTTTPLTFAQVLVEAPEGLPQAPTIDPPRVAVTLQRQASTVVEYEIPTMVIKVAKPAALEDRLRVKVDRPVLQNVTVMGPTDIIERLRRTEAQAWAVLDVPPGVVPGEQRSALRIELPPGVTLVGEPPSVDYEVTELAP